MIKLRELLNENRPDKGKVLLAKDIDQDMMDYFDRTNVKLEVTPISGNKYSASVGKQFGDTFFFGDGAPNKATWKLQLKQIKSVKILGYYGDLNSFSDAMKGGRYDGMHDIYEYGEPGQTDNGTKLEFNSKYVHFNPKAPFASWPDVKRMLIDMQAGKYVWGVLSLEDAIKKCKTYSVKDSDIQKALQYI